MRFEADVIAKPCLPYFIALDRNTSSVGDYFITRPDHGAVTDIVPPSPPSSHLGLPFAISHAQLMCHHAHVEHIIDVPHRLLCTFFAHQQQTALHYRAEAGQLSREGMAQGHLQATDLVHGVQ